MTWPNSKAAWMGYLLGIGMTAHAVASRIDSTPGLVRQMRRQWELPAGGAKRGVRIELDQAHRKLLEKRAKAQGIEPAEFLRRISICALQDDMYAAIVDGSFD